MRACYAALRMQESVTRYSDDMQRSHGIPVQIRIGLNSGEVVLRALSNDLHMDYTAVVQTTALADELGMRPLAAHCHFGLGTLYTKISRFEQASPELFTAIALYRTLEMTFWLPQAEATLAQVEGGP